MKPPATKDTSRVRRHHRSGGGLDDRGAVGQGASEWECAPPLARTTSAARPRLGRHPGMAATGGFRA